MEELFASIKEVSEQQETLIFACGLMDQPGPFVEMICDRIASEYRQPETVTRIIANIESTYLLLCDILVALAKEIAKSCTVHPLHNMWINYMSNRQDTVFIPSKFYVFHRPSKTTGAVKCIHDTYVPSKDLRPAECSIVTRTPDVSQVIFKLGKIRQVCITHLVVDTIIPDYYILSYSLDIEKAVKQRIHVNKGSRLFHREFGHLHQRSAPKPVQLDEKLHSRWTEQISMIRLSENAQIIIIQNFPPLVKHVTPQLCYCTQLQVLGLTNTALPEELGTALRVMKDLKKLYLEQCIIEPYLFKTIVEKLSVCKKLELLSLKKTLNVPIEIGETLTQLTSLRYLDVHSCKMSSAVSEALLQGLTQCPKIKYLYLCDNILTGLLDKLLSVSIHHKLCSLYLEHAGLSVSDVRSIAMAARANNLPNLTTLNVSWNTLPGLIGVLMGGADHPGYTSLENIAMAGMRFSKDDMKCLSKAVTGGKLPRLQCLILCHNNFHLMTEEVQHFVRICVEWHSQQQVVLMLGLNNLTNTFVEKLKSIVKRTRIKLTFSETSEEAIQIFGEIGVED